MRSVASTVELLAYLRSLDVQLTADGGRLTCEAPKGVLTPHLQRELKSRKSEILEILRQSGAPVTPAKRDSFTGLCINECFEAQAAMTPEAIAVVAGSERLTYRELSIRSNRLANRLRAMGVGSDVLAGICLDRSAEMVIALLAVLKAGGAYIPLDPRFPRERLGFMLEDSGAALLVTRRDLLDAVPRTQAQALCLDESRESIDRESAKCPARVGGPENLAYVIYTSGSTGKPKGVALEHRSVVNFLGAMRKAPGISEDDRLLAITTLSFDIAGLEIYLPLIAGARLIIAPRAAAVDGAALARLLRESEASIMQATPATWRLLLDSGWDGLPRLKMLCGGEALSRELANRLLATGGELWNLYGPTETTIWSTIHRVDSRTGAVPIGRPIANTQVYVLDDQRQLAPPGVVGELYIGGDGLAREYLGRPEITAERFVADPFRAGNRMFRTGDLVRRLADGNLEYLGRQDRQIKLRGFRIELGEIEAAIEQERGVRQAVVELREDDPGDQRLTAYIVSAPPVDAKKLRQSLATRLPEYAVPSAFVFLDAFPLTPNNKVDRKALPAPGSKERIGPALAAIRMGSTAEQLAAIWRTLLKVSEIGLHDDFFALGGHSLLIVQLQSRIRQQFSHEPSIAELFQRPTIAAQAELLDGARETSAPLTDGVGPTNAEVNLTPNEPAARAMPLSTCLVQGQPGGTRVPLFLVAGYTAPEDTLVVLARIVPYLGSDQPVYGFKPRWVDGVREMYSSVEEEAGEYLTELRSVQPSGPYLLGGYCISGIVAMEMARQLLREGEQVALLALIDTERPTVGRRLAADAWAGWERAKHMLSVIFDAVRWDAAAHELLHRKIRNMRPGRTEILPHEAYHRSKKRYQRLLWECAAKPYAGRVTFIENEGRYRFDRDMGWRGFPFGEVVFKKAPGDHITMFTDHGKELAQLLLKSIDEVLPEGARRADCIEVGAL